MGHIIDRSKVLSVYSGKAGKCCCGCAGKHTYASQYAAAGAARRGYPMFANEINDRTINLICDKIEAVGGKIEDRHVYATIGDQLYIAYFAD